MCFLLKVKVLHQIDHPLEGIKILPHLSEKKIQLIIDGETGIKIAKEISKERKKGIENEKDRLYQGNLNEELC